MYFQTKLIDLSLILSFYNDGPMLPQNLNKIFEVLDKSNLKYEVILIDDKSQDQSANLAKKTIANRSNCRFYQHQENIGRGGTVSEGFKLSEGRVIGFIDTDLEISPDRMPEAARLILNSQADIVTGLRSYKFYLSSVFRFIITKGYHYLVRFLIDLPLEDTETGFKFFNREKILPVLNSVKDKRWFWDTEIMALSYYAKLKIKEIPVAYKRRLDKKSTVNVLSDSIEYFKKLIKFRRRIKNYL